MTLAGPEFGSNIATVTPGTAWTTPSNAGANDAANTTSVVATAGFTATLRVLDMGFAIPGGATIQGIEVAIERMATGARCSDSVVQLRKSTGVVGSNLSAGAAWSNATTGIAVQAFGHATNLWGVTWTPAEINATTFGVDLRGETNASSITCSIDYVTISVTYTEIVDLTKVIVSDLGLPETVVRVGTRTITVTSVVSLPETHNRLGVSTHVEDSTVGLLETHNRLGTALHVISTVVGLLETVGKTSFAGLIRVIDAVVGLLSGDVRSGGAQRVVGEAIGLVESEVNVFHFFVTKVVDEVVGIVSLPVTKFLFFVTKVHSEALAILTEPNRIDGFIRSVVEDIGVITDPITTTGRAFRRLVLRAVGFSRRWRSGATHGS